MFTWTSGLIQTLVQEATGVHADVFKRVNAAYPYGVRLWDEDTGNTFEVRLCKSLDDAIYSARGATICDHFTTLATLTMNVLATERQD
jgi:hypothetical protein